jgi:hypothetical protein
MSADLLHDMVSTPAVQPKCWICGGPATTGEHKTKRSDLRSAFGIPTQDNPLYLHNAEGRNRRIGSLDAKVLKSPGKICLYCNSTRTQPHDRAWEKLSEALRTWTPAIGPGSIVRTKRIFPYNTAREMLNVHLYFVKLFGCHIAGNDIPLDISGFAYAIMNQTAHPCVYLKFGCGRMFAGRLMTGMSDIWIDPPSPGGSSRLATWFYDIEAVNINVMFAVGGEGLQKLVGVWHPRKGTTRLAMADYREPADAA